MTCADPDRHVQLIGCPHESTAAAVTLITMEDGCSGRLCAVCEHETEARFWRDVADRISGPPGGLDLLQFLRAANRDEP